MRVSDFPIESTLGSEIVKKIIEIFVGVFSNYIIMSVCRGFRVIKIDGTSSCYSRLHHKVDRATFDVNYPVTIKLEIIVSNI